MPYEAKLRRRAAKLGVSLPEGDRVYNPPLRASSGGRDVLTFGQGRVTRFVSYRPSDGQWTVKLGRREVGDFKELGDAVTMAKWLGRKANRAALRGHRPKVAKEAAAPKEQDATEALKGFLTQVNGGAVKVS